MRAAAALTLVLAAACATAPPRDARFDAVRRKLQQAVAARQLASVSVAVAVDGRVVWEEAFGYADVERGIRATPDTQYAVASITKPITATGVMVLAGRGLVDLSRPINDYLGGDAIRGYADEASRATVRAVLQHRAGLAEHNRYYFPGETRPPVLDIVRDYGFIAWPANEKYRYSNIGYGALEALIEQVSGRSYAAFLRDEVFLPLGMTRSSVGPGAGAAVLHGPELQPIRPYDFASRGAGYVFSTPRDLVRFALAGYAWYGHDGGMPGASSRMKIVPSRNIVVVTLSNSRADLTYDAADEILDALIPEFAEKRKADPSLKPAPPAPSSLRERIAGTWRGEIVTRHGTAPLTLTAGAASLRLKIGDAPECALEELRFSDVTVEGGCRAAMPLLPDIPEPGYDVWLEAGLRDGELRGTLSAYSPPMQTNLYALSDAAIALLKQYRVGFGVSFDVVRGIRLSVSGETTEDRVLANLGRLREAGVDCGAITVLAKHTCGMICDIFDFWAERGFSFRVLPLFAGPPSRELARFTASESELVDALCRLFAHWMRSRAPVSVAPLDEWLANVVRHRLGLRAPAYDRRRRGESVLVVRPDGTLFQVSEAGDERRSLGDLKRQTMTDVLESEAYRASLDRSDAVTRQRCTGCRFRGGCDGWPAHTAAVDHPAPARCHVAYRVHDYIDHYLQRAGIGLAALERAAAYA